jgi:phosphomannomutase
VESAPPSLPIRFGSGGWRGILGEDFTFARARALASAVGGWAAAARPGAPVVVAHDTRFLADRAADEVAEAIGAEGVPVLRAGRPAPTPAVCRAVVRRRCAAGVIVTASHNPAAYLGVKVVGPAGACVARDVQRALEREAALRLAAPRGEARAPSARKIEPTAPYVEEVARLLDRDAFRGARLEVVYDAFHGAGAGALDTLLRRCGARVQGRRMEADPRFGGDAPDPTRARLGPLARAVRALGGSGLGLATDGDADRFAAVDGGGRALSETEALALLVDHLATTRRLRGTLALSRAAGSLAARVAASHGLSVARHPTGFGALATALSAGEAVLGGDESGGFAWAPFARDKDGILAGALLAERAASERGALRRALRALERRFGRSACGRTALPATPSQARALARLAGAPPVRFDAQRVDLADASDGVRLELADGGFVLWRLSGTEPVLRVYAEAGSATALRRRLAAAEALVARAAR